MRFRPLLRLQSWLELIHIYGYAAAATTLPATSVASSPSPTSTVDPNFIGTYIGVAPETTYTIDCSYDYGDGPYVSSSTYANCCAGGLCEFAIMCQYNTAWYSDYWVDCGTNQCGTMTIFDSYPSPSQSWIWQTCFTDLSQNTVYRTIQTTSSTTSTTTFLITTIARTSFVIVPAPTSSLTPITSPTTSAKPVNNQRSSSKAWIAGAVVGPIAFVAVVGVLAFWFLRRRREPIPTGDQRPVSGQIGYVRSMPPAISNSK